ncbi:hypothetical protein CMV30_17195 [Nibricoccus aquaticus]|uniref:Uncharacterized protein n=1 Tax=Nibricoccus aquaticus TaxID=2576891 RepID=A0A290QA24_9BACT|nr:hypothetical protein CMV30_17195 [Nibricoccus aquaticus]
MVEGRRFRERANPVFFFRAATLCGGDFTHGFAQTPGTQDEIGGGMFGQAAFVGVQLGNELIHGGTDGFKMLEDPGAVSLQRANRSEVDAIGDVDAVVA